MRAELLTAVVLVTLPLQMRGAIEKVAVPNPSVAAGTSVSITVTGRNPCGAVRLNYGDGTEAITHPLTEVPATIQYTYARPGTYEILAEGMGNCDGVARTSLSVRPVPSAPEPRPDAGFRKMDENSDGVVTLNEWRGSARAFRIYDTNGDRVITAQEFPAAGEAAPATEGEIVVSPKVRWTDTGIYLREGEVVQLQASGIVQLSNDPADNGDPGGVHSGRRAPNAPLGSRVAGALIARVGDSAPILVGRNPTLRAPTRGQLYLGVNDDTLADNKGQFRVRILPGAAERAREKR
jgi:hypothetical protein